MVYNRKRNNKVSFSGFFFFNNVYSLESPITHMTQKSNGLLGPRRAVPGWDEGRGEGERGNAQGREEIM